MNSNNNQQNSFSGRAYNCFSKPSHQPTPRQFLSNRLQNSNQWPRQDPFFNRYQTPQQSEHFMQPSSQQQQQQRFNQRFENMKTQLPFNHHINDPHHGQRTPYHHINGPHHGQRTPYHHTQSIPPPPLRPPQQNRFPPLNTNLNPQCHQATPSPPFPPPPFMPPPTMFGGQPPPRFMPGGQPPNQFMPGHFLNQVNQKDVIPSSTLPPPTKCFSYEIQIDSRTRETEEADRKAERLDRMKEMVNKWMNSKSISNADKTGEKNELLKIHNYKLLMEQLVSKVDELRQLNDTLAENMETDGSTWASLIDEVKNCKACVAELQEKLSNERQVMHIARLVEQRRKKRVRNHNRKKRLAEQHVQALSKRIKLNEKIDEWQHKESARIQIEKMTESLKNDAGESLNEVKRKQTEASELIEVFRLLRELRDTRKETAIYKGIFITDKDDSNFIDKVEQATDLLQKQKRHYEDEERALRVLREEEAEDFERVEVEKRKKRKQKRENALSCVDPMSMFRMYWLQAEESIAGLVHVRSLWDTWLCPPSTLGGSRMPESLPEPIVSSGKGWEKYLVVQTKAKNSPLNKLEQVSLQDTTES